ncbi:uncharacterized protein [Drosophila takahashii]|uniref:uncharacterized protein n=1 Tax=Drosophila takahashii TaxID=29030 RepID=UPI003898EDB4
MFSDTDDGHEQPNGGQRIRNVLTLEERVAAIRQYDIVPMYSKIARNFNCSWEQIKSIVTNREAILEFQEATNRLSQPANKDAELRRRKLNFLGHCLYEYIQRAQFYLHSDINEEMIRNRAIEFRDLMRLDGFVPNKPWINHFKAAYNITLSNRQITITRRPPRSMDLRDIMSYCGRHTSMACSLVPRSPEASPLMTSQMSEHRSSVVDRSLYRTKTLVATSTQNQATSDEVHLRRKRKIAFLEKCMYEYIQRSQLHNKGRLDMDNLRSVAISLRDILKIESFFPDKVWFKHFKSRYNFTFSVGVPATSRRVPLSLDLRDIVSYCGRNEHKITLAHKKTQDQLKAGLVHFPPVEPKPEDAEPEDDDDCVAIEVPPELIEIKDDEDDDSLERGTKRKLEEDEEEISCGLKIQKIQSLSETFSDTEELPHANSPGHYSETSDEANLPRCVESYKDALRLLKPLEEFALMEENYRAIGLLTQLEKIFESGAKKNEEQDKAME